MRQFVFNRFLKAYAGRSKGRLAFTFWSILRKYILTRGKFVYHTIGKFTLKIEASHILPMVMIDHPLYSKNIIELVKVVQQKYPNLTVIDIGANIGDTAAFILNEVQVPVLCIDGSAEYIGILKENVASMNGVDVCFTLLGADDVTMRAEVKNHDGTAMLVDSEQEVKIQKLSTVLRQFPKFASTKLIKVDTDGFDTLILKGSADVLKANKPVLFFEYDPDFLKLHGEDDLSIFTFLKDCGYDQLVVWDNLGNYLYKLSLSDTAGIKKMHQDFEGKKNREFVDIAVFAIQDRDLSG